MEEISDWIKAIVLKSCDNKPMDVQNVGQMIERKELTIERVVTDLGSFLTNTEPKERSKGLNILSNVLNSLPNDLLSPKEVELLTHFYCDRLKDHYSVIPNVFPGIIAIIDCLSFGQNWSQLVFKSLVKEISVQQYSVSDRFLLFQLLTKLLDKHLEELTAIRPEFIYGLIQLIEGERDPRCLLLVFRLAKSVAESIDLDPYTEDFFEVISCYFPVLFTPPPNDDYGITKEDLSEALVECLSASSTFAEFLFPLVLEKLESELRSAKIDSFKAIENVCPNYGYEKIQTYIPELWTCIRIESLKPELLENEVSEFALKALTSISDTMASKQSNIDSFVELIWKDISNAFNKPELDLMESAVNIVLATVSSNVYTFNRFVAQLMSVFLKQFTFCQKESIRVVIIDSLSRILSHSRKLSEKPTKLINSESLFTLLTSLSIADSEPNALRESIISCLQQLIQTIELTSSEWKVISHVLHSLLNNCFDFEKILSNTYALIESITSLNPQISEELIKSLIDNWDLDYSTETNRKRLNCSLNALELASTPFHLFELICTHLVQQIKSNSYYIDDNQEMCSLELTKSLWNCIVRQTKSNDIFDQKVNLFLYDHCFDPLIQLCVHVSICTDNKSGTEVNLKLMKSLFSVIGKGVSKLDHKCSQRLFDKLLHFSILGKVDQLLPVLPPTCFCTYVTGHQFLDTLNGTQALIVFGLIEALVSNLKYESRPNDWIQMFDKLLFFATNNKYNNRDICYTSTQTIGAFVNRFDDKNDILNEKLNQMLSLFKNTFKDNKELKENELLINVLVWITKGLVISGHSMRTQFIDAMIWLFESKNKLIRNQISNAFAVIHGSDDSALTRDNNAKVRILYHQSFFLDTFDALLNGYLKHKSEDSDKRQTYLTALLTQLKFIPKAVFRNQLNRLLPMLLDAISSNSCYTNQTAALEAITQILVDRNERILDPSLKSTVNSCVDMAINSTYLKVRRSALNCLAQIANTFDDSVLNHLRDEVVRSLRKTLNDKKRIVRKSAANARCKWILVGQPGK